MVLSYLNQYINHSTVSHTIINYDRILDLLSFFFRACGRPPIFLFEDSTSSLNNFLLLSGLILLFLGFGSTSSN